MDSVQYLISGVFLYIQYLISLSDFTNNKLSILHLTHEYIGFEILYAAVDEKSEAKPYFDGCLVASKPEI